LDKQAILQQIIDALLQELEGYERSARNAHAEATDEQSKAENKYDTRGLEASYLARGQSRQAAETMEALGEYQALQPREFATGALIDLGAVVQLEEGKDRTWYFVGPRSGGLEVTAHGAPMLVITPQSPLGQQLMGKKAGGTVQLPRGKGMARLKIVTVC
jgi:transcription elongation GreA/GreB family factor